MTQHVPLDFEDPAPEEFFDAVQEMMSGAAVNFLLRQKTSTAIKVAAGAGHDQVSLSIGGAYRWITADVEVTHPGGAAGTYVVWATALANQAPPAAGPAGGNHAFALAITSGGNPAGAAIFRKVGLLVWSGAVIRQLDTIVGGASESSDGILVGMVLDWPGEGDPLDTRYLAADGRLVNSTDFPEYDSLVGAGAPVGQRHKFNGGVDPGGGKFRISDGRGGGRVGADNLGTAQGAAGRLTSSGGVTHPNTVGARGGQDKIQLSAAQSGMPAHNPSVSVSVSIGPQLGNILGDDGNASGTTFGFTTGAGNLVKRQNQYGVTGASGAASVGAVGASNPHSVMGAYEVYTPIVRVR